MPMGRPQIFLASKDSLEASRLREKKPLKSGFYNT